MGLIYEGSGLWGGSSGGNDLGEVEEAEGGVHGGCRSWGGNGEDNPKG